MKKKNWIILGIGAAVVAGAVFGGIKLVKNPEFIWNVMWKRYESAYNKENIHLTASKEFKDSTIVFDWLNDKEVEGNINTHRAVYLQQSENGVITSEDLEKRFDTKIKISDDGTMKTADGKPGIAEPNITYKGANYKIVFTDLPFYAGQDDKMFETGGFVTTDITVDEDKILENNLLSTGTITVGKDTILEVRDGVTLVTAGTKVSGILKGYVTGKVDLEDGGMFNGALLLGDITASGNSTVMGMLIGERLKVNDNATLRMKEFGGLFTIADLGKNVTLEFEDGEPLFMQADVSDWTVDTGNSMSTGPKVTGENSTGGNWYISYTKTPTDMLGRAWVVEPLTGNGVLRTGIGGLGYVKNEPDLKLEVVNDTEHNFAMMVMNRYPISHVKGNLEVFVKEGIACPEEDVNAITLGKLQGDGSENKPYTIEVSVKEGYQFSSAEEIAMKAVMKPILKEASDKVDDFNWKSAVDEQGYTFYGYTGKEADHWTGPTGTEECIVRVVRK